MNAELEKMLQEAVRRYCFSNHTTEDIMRELAERVRRETLNSIASELTGLAGDVVKKAPLIDRLRRLAEGE